MNQQSSAAQSKRIAVVDSGKVVTSPPPLFTRPNAAAYAGCSVGLLDKYRASDHARQLRGVPIESLLSSPQARESCCRLVGRGCCAGLHRR